MISFDSVTLVPKVISEKRHRSECTTSSEFCGVQLETPLIASPMPDVCNGTMALELAELGCLGIIHRFQPIMDQLKEFKMAKWTDPMLKLQNIACAVGVTGDYEERFEALYNNGCRIFCLDTANGANIMVKEAVEKLRANQDRTHVYLIAGNVATVEGYAFLTELGVDAVRVGIAGGSVCETKTETGVHVPTLQSVLDIKGWRLELHNKPSPKIIADGGIRTPSDLCKALACGADAIMCGSIFAGTKESPGDVLKIDGKLYKLYRGAASYSVQQEAGRDPLYNEGNETLVRYKGEVRKVVDRFTYGLQSSMSYMNAGNLDEFRVNTAVERL
jgi:IMP dehydrogenase